MTAAQQSQTRAALTAGTFFVRVDQVGQATERDESTAPLFPLWLILDADGTLAPECRPIVERTQA